MSDNDERLRTVEASLGVLTSVVNQWMENTKDYRVQLCGKIDEVRKTGLEDREELRRILAKIFEKLEKLPCDKRGGWYSSMSNQIKLQWGIIMVGVTAFIYEWVKKK